MAAQLQRRLVTISQAWPKDYLRPNLQFSGAILSASARIFGGASSATPSTSALPQTPASTTGGRNEEELAKSGAGPASGAGGPLSEPQLFKAERMVASLDNLLGDKARKAYPITKKTLEPASFPKHYSRILDGVAAAKRGDSATPGAFSWIRWK